MARRRTDTLAAGAALLLAAPGLLDVLVLLPRTLAPFAAATSVWRAVASAGDLAPVLAGPVVWAVLCAGAAAWHVRARRALSPARGAVVLVELGVLALLQQVAAFGLGLWLSNHLPPFEGGSTALGSALLLLGGLAVVVGLAMIALSAIRRRAIGSAPAQRPPRP